MRKASEATPISTTVLRCGQMTGGPSGAWNDHEWFPSLIKSSVTMGKLPASSGVRSSHAPYSVTEQHEADILLLGYCMDNSIRCSGCRG